MNIKKITTKISGVLVDGRIVQIEVPPSGVGVNVLCNGPDCRNELAIQLPMEPAQSQQWQERLAADPEAIWKEIRKQLFHYDWGNVLLSNGRVLDLCPSCLASCVTGRNAEVWQFLEKN